MPCVPFAESTHNGYEGRRTVKIALPRTALVSDLFTSKRIVEGSAFEITLDAPETKLMRLDYR